MAGPSFTELAWKSLTKGSQAYLTSLAAHHTEVTEWVLSGSFSVQGKAHQREGKEYQLWVSKLLDEAQTLPISDASTPRTSSFVRGRCPR